MGWWWVLGSVEVLNQIQWVFVLQCQSNLAFKLITSISIFHCNRGCFMWKLVKQESVCTLLRCEIFESKSLLVHCWGLLICLLKLLYVCNLRNFFFEIVPFSPKICRATLCSSVWTWHRSYHLLDKRFCSSMQVPNSLGMWAHSIYAAQ